MFSPSWRIPRKTAPMNAPITVPDPPWSSVPPMTAAEMAWNRMTLEPEGSGGGGRPNRPHDADEPGQERAQHEVPGQHELGADARLRRAQPVAADRDRID